MHDLDRLKPFRGQAANITATVIVTVGKPGEAAGYPVPYLSYVPADDGKITEDSTYTEFRQKTLCRKWIAKPIDSNDTQSSWIFGEKEAIDILFRIIGKSFYAPSVREGINTRGANGVFFVDSFVINSRLFIRNRPDDGDDPGLKKIEHSIEKDYVFPLLRGKDVERWVALPSSFVLMPHEPEHPANPVPFTKLPKSTREFLSAFKEKLSSRKKFRNFDPASDDWHGLYSVLDATFAGHKVVWREMADGAIAATISTAELPSGSTKIVAPDHKLFLIPCNSQAEAEFVCGVFNSLISSYLIKSYALATGISTHVLDRLPIPRFDHKNVLHDEIAAQARKCTLAARTGKDLQDAEEKLDIAVARLFDVKELGAIRAARHRLDL